MKDWKYLFAEHRGALAAAALFVVMFSIYVANHPAGLTPNVVQTAANKGVLLALVAMGQTFVVLTAGIDLSVGMIFILCNCIASYVVAGPPTLVALGIAAVLAAGLLCGAVNGAIVIFGRLQPIVATIASGAVFFGMALWLRPSPGASPAFSGDLADLMTGKILNVFPASAVFPRRDRRLRLVPVPPLAARACSLRHRFVRNVGYMSGLPVQRAKFAAYLFSGFFLGPWRSFLDFFHLFRRGFHGEWKHLYALFDRRGGARRSVLIRRPWQRGRGHFRRVGVPGDRRFAFCF